MMAELICATLKIKCSPKLAKILFQSVSIDNIREPLLEITEKIKNDNIIEFNIKSYKGIGSVLNTVDDLIACLKAAYKVYENVGGLKVVKETE